MATVFPCSNECGDSRFRWRRSRRAIWTRRWEYWRWCQSWRVLVETRKKMLKMLVQLQKDSAFVSRNPNFCRCLNFLLQSPLALRHTTHLTLQSSIPHMQMIPFLFDDYNLEIRMTLRFPSLIGITVIQPDCTLYPKVTRNLGDKLLCFCFELESPSRTSGRFVTRECLSVSRNR